MNVAKAGKSTRLCDAAVLIAVVIAVWWGLSLLLGVKILPGPWPTVQKAWEIISREDFEANVLESLKAFSLALVIAWFAGLSIGILLGTFRLAGEVAEPILVALYSIPKITLYPVILLLFGLGMSAKVAFGVIHGIVPVMIFTMNGIRNIPAVYFRAAQTMHLRPLQVACHVVLPAALPEVVTGFRFGFSLTLLGTLIGEMFASQRGVGYELIRSMETNDVESVMAWALILVVVATIVSILMLSVDRRMKRRLAG